MMNLFQLLGLRTHRHPSFSRQVFRLAGIYGLIVLLPLYFVERQVGVDFPPPITHPEFYYGFLGVTLAWQILFLLISRDPPRYRLIILPSILAKISYVAAVFTHHVQSRVHSALVPFAIIDLLLAVLFTVAYFRTRSSDRGNQSTQVLVTIACASFLFSGCTDGTTPVPTPQNTRTYRMGFSGIPPRGDIDIAIASIDMWSSRADAAIISFEVPWDSLLAGIAPETLVVRDQLGLANYFRFKGHELWVYLDPANGLNRAGEADALIRNGRSITEPEIQQLFRKYSVAIDSIIEPERLGLALETNLIRGIAPAALYAAIRQVANDAAADVRVRDSLVNLSVSVQVEYAWGRFSGGVFQGIDVDLNDFPFIEELGLSSYPYLAGFSEPEDIPLNYYSQLLGGRDLPVMVTEGGWTSVSLDTIVSSPDEQRRYIVHHSELLDAVQAIGVFQLTFTDLDLIAHPPPPGSILPLFANLGLVDINLNPKPALAAWDETFGRPKE